MNIPYQVSVEVLGDFRCTGAIISMFWVTTIGSCVQNVSASDVVVRAATAMPHRRGSVHKIYQLLTPHDCNAHDCPQDNVALLKVHTRFKFSRKIRPVTLWPRTPPSGHTGLSTTRLCIQDQVPINILRQITVLDPDFCVMAAANPGHMCIFSAEQHSTNNGDLCQNTGALVIVSNRLAGFVLRSYNRTVDICLPLSHYISWIKQVAFGVL